MRTLRIMWLARIFAVFTGLSLIWLQTAPAFGAMKQQERIDEASKPKPILPTILTQAHKPGARTADALTRQAVRPHPAADVRLLTAGEMARARGRGPYRNPYLNGSAQSWQRAFHDVNVCTGNLFKSFTDVQVAPARGAGLVLQRTYNSNDSRIGPFGVGCTHAYDIRIDEAGDDNVPRTDFFGGKRTYHRDADGLYTPPAYLHDSLVSTYAPTGSDGSTDVLDDTDTGMDGTAKHYIANGKLANGGVERVCDWIQDRHGNRTTLAYNQTLTSDDGMTHQALTQVTDPSGRSLVFTWANLNPGDPQNPRWRVTQVQGPLDQGQVVAGVTYTVQYNYYTDPNEPNAANDLYNLQSVTLDPGAANQDHLNRTTTFTYRQYSDANGTENGLLAGITDPLGHTVSYQYGLLYQDLWVTQITEPGSGGPLIWTISDGNSYLEIENNNVNYHERMDFQCDTLYRLDYCSPHDIFAGGAYYLYYTPNSYHPIAQSVNDSLAVVQRGPMGGELYQYGPFDNVTAHGYSASGDGFSYTGTYTTRGWWILPDSKYWTATTYTYGDASTYFQKQSTTDGNGHTTTVAYFDTTGQNGSNLGNQGEVRAVQDAGFSDPQSPSYGKQYTYLYNQYGQKTQQTDLNGIVTLYTYGDAWGNLTRVVQDSATDVNGSPVPLFQGRPHLSRTTTMTYDAAGRVVSSTDPNAKTSTFQFNTLGQPVTVSTPASLQGVKAETLTYVYGANGRLHSVTDGRGPTTLTYEDEHYGSAVNYGDRVYSVTDPDTSSLTYTYLPTGERQTMTLPGGQTWTYAYSQNNGWSGTPGSILPPPTPGCLMPGGDPNAVTATLQSITDNQGRVVNYTFGAAGHLYQAVSDPVYNSSGAQVAALSSLLSYDAAARSSGAQNAPSGGHFWLQQLQTSWQSTSGQNASRVVWENDYTYDGVGQRQTNTVITGNNAGATTSRTERYGYDGLNRLASVDYGDGQTQGYTFDALGNRVGKTDSVAGAATYGFDAANRLTGTTGGGASTYASDANGNTTDGGGRHNVWDSQNRLVSCTVNGVTSTYTYGADGLRRSSTVNGVRPTLSTTGRRWCRRCRRTRRGSCRPPPRT